MLLCVGGLGAVTASLRCTDAAREAARLAARGDPASATEAARTVAPAGAVLRLRTEGGFVIATVSTASRVLPAVTISAQAVAALESMESAG